MEQQGQAVCVCPAREDCPADIALVCGTDKKTYINKCVLDVISCKTKKRVGVASKGACGKRNI